jgi:hypothetical protein
MVDQDVDMVVVHMAVEVALAVVVAVAEAAREAKEKVAICFLGISGDENVMRGQETAKILLFPLPLTNHPRNLKS